MSQDPRRLVVTADDLGLHRGMTDGALIAHERGVVTAASISACGNDLDHAIEAVRPYSDLDVGIHFTLVGERPILRGKEVASLTDGDGRFPLSYKAFALRWAAGRIDLDEVEAELSAQAERLAGAGVELVHANGHQHLHVFPGIVDRVIAVCEAFEIAYLRIPRESAPGGLGFRRAAIAVMNTLGRRARTKAARARLTSNEWTIGIADAGRLTSDTVLRLIPLVRGVTELVAHPGARTGEIGTVYDWGYRWEDEIQALCSDEVRRALAAHDIELIRTRDLKR